MTQFFGSESIWKKSLLSHRSVASTSRSNENKKNPKAKAAAHKADTIDLDNLMVTPEERAAARKLLEQSSDPIVAKKNNMAQMAHWAKANGIEYVCSSRGETRANYLDKYFASA